MGAINPADKRLEVYINGELVEFLHMRLGSAGCAYFVEDINSPPIDSDNESVSSNTTYDYSAPREQLLRVRSAEDVSNKLITPPRTRPRRRKTRKSVGSCESQPTYDLPENYSQPFDFLTDSRVYMSDSEIDKQCTERLSVGSLDEKKSLCIQQDGDATSTSQPIFPTAIPSREHEGVYLEDLVTQKIDESTKQAYLYVVKSKTACSCSQESGAFDAGYRSDPEQPAYWLSSANNQIFELKLSLCGGLSADSTIDEERFFAHLVTFEDFSKDPSAIVTNPNLVILLNGKFYNWNTAAPMILSYVCFRTELPYSSISRLLDTYMPKKQPRRRAWFTWGNSDPEPIAPEETPESLEPPSQPPVQPEVAAASPVEATEVDQPKRKITLTSEEIENLSLKPGENTVEFRIVTKYQGTASCSAKIFLWQWDDKVVVSDVDGTITKSDLLGHVLPMLGHDWTHAGVAELYTKIAENGYRFIYLSARAIGQAGVTRNYLEQVIQRDNYRLPVGPILLSPTSLFNALHREVISRTPEIFKIECLKEVRQLFGPEGTPFFSAFGNRTNDVMAYLESGFKLCRIFTVNSNGELRNERLPNYNSTFEEIIRLVDHLFPFFVPKSTDTDGVCDLVESEDEYTPPDMSVYSTFSFWHDTAVDGISTCASGSPITARKS